jgi:hypothetical protein
MKELEMLGEVYEEGEEEEDRREYLGCAHE